VRGYEVVSSDKRVVGRVADVRDGYLIVESGRLHRSRRPVPREFIHVVDEAAQVFVTVPRRVLRDAPEVDRRSNFDLHRAARHFGLAEAYLQPPSQGNGVLLPHDSAWGADRDTIAAGRQPPEHRRAEIRKHMRPGRLPEHDHAHRSPALLGDRHWGGRRLNED
jgi:hypothetical protein